MTIPLSIAGSISLWLDEFGSGSHRVGSAKLRETYKSGQSSAHADLAAYLVTRAPATFASVSRALRELALTLPDFRPASLLDVGSGAGSATWAADAQFELGDITCIDNDHRFLALAEQIARWADMPSLAAARFLPGSLQATQLPQADLVTAAYVLAELPEAEAASSAVKLWQAAREAVAIVEPGTPSGFSRIRRAREALIKAGAFIAAPCTHDNACPMQGDDWCHFTVRLSRSREHMHAKQARVPFEDEPFAYVVATRHVPARAIGRILKPLVARKGGLGIETCEATGITQRTVAKRDKAEYKRVRKATWGDAI
jgi:ribosomal protein RSM22 (predicted rRNA methylase)